MDKVSVKTRDYSRLNNHWKEVKDPKPILADQHFESKKVIYSTIIDRLTNTNTLFLRFKSNFSDFVMSRKLWKYIIELKEHFDVTWLCKIYNLKDLLWKGHWQNALGKFVFFYWLYIYTYIYICNVRFVLTKFEF